MRLFTYNEFFRLFVQRKKQEFVDPNFTPISEVVLPKGSLFHFVPNNREQFGPNTSEAFVSNFPGDVFINFSQVFTPVLDNGRFVAFDFRKAIQSYRATHYTYNWTKDISTVYNKENTLVVKNYALAERTWVQRPGMFVNFETHYNRLDMLIKGINEEAVKARRKQYVRVELPMHIPPFLELMVDYGHYTKGFKDGLPVPINSAIRLTKAENTFWLLDLLAFLLGDYQYSQFSKLTPQAEDDLHWMFTANGKVLVINVKTVKGWLDELNTPSKAGVTPEDYTTSPKRLNAIKRFYMALMMLTMGSSSEKVIEGASGAGAGPETQDNASVVEGAKGAAQGQGRASGDGEEGQVPGTNEHLDDSDPDRSLVDVFRNNKRNDPVVDEGQGDEGEHSAAEDAGDWTSAVDDKLLEIEQTDSDIVVGRDVFSSPEKGVALALEERARDGSLTVAEQTFFMRKAVRYQSIEMENGQSLAEYVNITDEELKSLDGRIEGNFVTVLDESKLRSRTNVLKKQYVERFLKRDMAKMVLGLQNAGFALSDYRVGPVDGIEGSYDVHSIQIHHVSGSQSTHHIPFPRVDKDGNFTVDGVKQHMQLQRMEIPIRKISPHQVALTSYYDRKLMVKRSEMVVDDYGRWLVKNINLLAAAEKKRAEKAGEQPGLVASSGVGYNNHYISPRAYSLLAKKFTRIKLKGVGELNFKIDQLLEEYPEFKKYTTKDRFLMGVVDKQPITIDSFGNVMKGETELGTIEGLLGIDTRKAPIEHVTINISGYNYPIGVVLCYYFGIDTLMELTKATTRSVPMGTRPKLAQDEFAIAFNDEYRIFSRREKLPSLIFGGMVKLKNIGNFSRSDLNSKGVWVPLMGDPRVKAQHFKEMKNLYDLFIDPITKDELKRRGYSTDFHHLLIDAVTLLETDYARHEVELEEQRIVGYERFAGHMYREWVRAIRVYRNKGTERKHVLEMNPDAIILNILTDTSVNQVEEVNPIHQLKDQAEVTFGGVGGRSEITMVKRARQQLPSYRGKISEANKDSQKVGFVTYLTTDAGIADFRGNIAIGEKPTLTGLVSITGNLQYGFGHDDAKRSVFTSTQASQAVSATNYSYNSLRSGHENLVAHGTGELYSKVAADKGKVVEVTDTFINVRYDNGDVDIYPLGLKIGTAAGEYHRHTRVTDLKPGDTFNKGDVIGWDSTWFMRDPFCPGQVTWMAGAMVRMCLVEDQDVYEDSLAIAKSLANECRTPYLTRKTFIVEVDKVIDLKVKLGDSVDYDSILCDVEDPHLLGLEEQSELEKNINKIGIRQIKSSHHGEVVQFDVVYNANPDDMSDSVRKFITAQDKLLKKQSDIDGSAVKTNAVTNGLSVKKPMLAPGKALISITIESLDASTLADKYVVANQMKGTVGSIMLKKLMTRDGREILVKTSVKGMFNRMVLSYRNKLASNELTFQFTKQAIGVYRGTNK